VSGSTARRPKSQAALARLASLVLAHAQMDRSSSRAQARASVSLSLLVFGLWFRLRSIRAASLAASDRAMREAAEAVARWRAAIASCSNPRSWRMAAPARHCRFARQAVAGSSPPVPRRLGHFRSSAAMEGGCRSLCSINAALGAEETSPPISTPIVAARRHGPTSSGPATSVLRSACRHGHARALFLDRAMQGAVLTAILSPKGGSGDANGSRADSFSG